MNRKNYLPFICLLMLGASLIYISGQISQNEELAKMSTAQIAENLGEFSDEALLRGEDLYATSKNTLLQTTDSLIASGAGRGHSSTRRAGKNADSIGDARGQLVQLDTTELPQSPAADIYKFELDKSNTKAALDLVPSAQTEPELQDQAKSTDLAESDEHKQSPGAAEDELFRLLQKHKLQKSDLNADDLVTYFGFGAANLTATARAKLAKVAKLFPAQNFELIGYTDQTGDAAINARLSAARSLAVSEYLTSRGISQNQIDRSYSGSKNPAARNDTLAGRRLNRRVEIKVK